HGEERLSYSEIWSTVSALASGLRSLGVSRGDRVGILLPHSTSQVLSIFAISAADAVFVPINPLLFPDQVEHILADCGVTALITTKALLKSVAGVLERTLRVVLIVSNGGGAKPSIALPIHDFDELCAAQTSAGSNACIEKDLAAILYTSGSTGKPKGVMLSHAQIMAGTAIVSSYLEITPDDRILSILPLSFDVGLNQVMTAFREGGTAVLAT